MTPELEERRGAEAQHILDNAVYKEAWAAIRDRIVGQLEQADTPADQRQRLNDLLIAHRKAKQYMEQVMHSGTMAAQEIERQTTLRERVKERIRNW